MGGCWHLQLGPQLLVAEAALNQSGQTSAAAFSLSTGSPQGCVFSPHIIKFVNNTEVAGVITENDESACRMEVVQLSGWCRSHNLSLNVNKTQEMVIDFRRDTRHHHHTSLAIDGSTVEKVPGRAPSRRSDLREESPIVTPPTPQTQEGGPPCYTPRHLLQGNY